MPLFGHIRSPEAVEWTFLRQHRDDRVGHTIHVGLGLLWCVAVGSPTSVVELAAAPLYAFGLWRVRHVWRTWPAVLLSPQCLWLYAWAGWAAVTLAWSPDRRQGLEELGRLRFVGVMWMLWPVMDRRSWLIAGLAAGFIVGNVVQAGHVAGHFLDIGVLDWGRFADRYSGWWDPVVGGSLLCGALGLHIPAAMWGRGRERRLAAAGAAATVLGIAATGTRGAWVSSALLLAVGGVVGGIRWWRGASSGSSRHTGRRAPVSALCIVLGVAVTAGVVLGPSLARRVHEARNEMAGMVERDDYSTFTGARVLMWSEAIRAVAAHPVGGVGLGGYREWLRTRLAATPPDRPRPPTHAHAHSTPLHVAATTGLAGLMLAVGFAWVCLSGGLRGCTGDGGYAAGPGFALLGLLLAGLFDTVHVNAQTVALLFTLAALTVTPRPRPPGRVERRQAPAGS
jgi:hypothetical protein